MSRTAPTHKISLPVRAEMKMFTSSSTFLLVFSSCAVSALGAALNHTLVARAPIVFPPGWQVLNPCAIDTPDRILKSLVIRQMSDNSATTCMQICDKSGYTYAGLEYGNECHCGRGVVKGTQSAPTAECNMPCVGDALQSCGGSWRMQIYYTLSTTAKEPPLAPGWQTSYRCAVDVGDRVLLGDVTYTLGYNTPYNCQKYCQALGYKFAGVEYTNECHCGTGFRVQPTTVDVSECYMNCAGDSSYDCGGPWRIQIYAAGSSTGSTSTTGTTTTTTTTTSTSTSTTTSRTSTTSQTQSGTTSTTSTSTSSASTATQTSYGQCGGKGWTGPTLCGNGWACTYNNDYYSQCTYTGDTTKVQPYGQCGGKGWTGGTECSKGYSCVYSDAYFSQCLPS